MIFDAHSHICNRSGETDAQIAELKQAGISGTVFAPMQGVMAKTEEELDSGNQEALELFSRYPEFLYPGCSIHPEFQDTSMRWLKEFRARGLIWCGEVLSYVCNIPFDDERWSPLFDFCAKEGMILQMHNAPEVETIAKRHPRMTIIGSHLNPEVLPLLVKYPNVLIDISGVHGGLVRGTLKKALNMFGAHRLLFGTDYPGYDAEPFVWRVKRDFSEAEQQAICSRNLQSLFLARGVKSLFGRELQPLREIL